MHEPEQSSTQKLIAALWQRSQTQVLQRLALLDQAATDPLTPEIQQEAAGIAHKLAGSLGMFGFPEGSRIARELEQHLESPAPDHACLTALTAELRQAIFPASPDGPA
jgi:HPt (histidine-containing phosphotransfer) domain-containing protein